MMTPSEIVATAHRLADDVFFPAAIATDASDLVPARHLDLLAEAGFYGLTGPVAAGGMACDAGTIFEVVEILAGGCLTTAFVWRQHAGVVTAVAGSSNSALREQWLPELCRGRQRSGIALTAALPGPPLLTARKVAEGWLIDGRAPWVTGWGRVDVVFVAARDLSNNRVVRLLVDAKEEERLRAEPLRTVAVQASGTMLLHFDRLVVPEERLVGIEPYQERGSLAAELQRLRMNGAFSVGVAGRCCAILGPTPLDEALNACRHALEGATDETIAAARAGASALAMRAAAATVAAGGSRSVLMNNNAQRLAREAIFLLAFGQRPAIRAALVERLGASGRSN